MENFREKVVYKGLEVIFKTSDYYSISVVLVKLRIGFAILQNNVECAHRSLDRRVNGLKIGFFVPNVCWASRWKAAGNIIKKIQE